MRRATRRSRSSTASPSPPPNPLRTPLALVAVALSALLAAGCGAGGRVTSGDASHGKQLFQDPKNQCASCHVLADAGTKGTVGPNLDDAFSADKQQGFSEQTIRDVIRFQIGYPELPMPAGLLHGQDAADVAVYIAKCAGDPNCGVTASKVAAPAATTTAPGTSPLALGKQIFGSAGCAGCHVLKDAGATGTVGPNLDQLKPSEARVAKQVTNGGKVMPAFKGRLTSAQIDAVAAYVSSIAGKG
jgi:mono/diheme cytochrome c family protein